VQPHLASAIIPQVATIIAALLRRRHPEATASPRVRIQTDPDHRSDSRSTLPFAAPAAASRAVSSALRTPSTSASRRDRALIVPARPLCEGDGRELVVDAAMRADIRLIA